jgi:uncharacterized protein (TIGR00369 family)
MAEIPQGFEPLARNSPFLGLVGPLYQRRRTGEALSVGMRIEQHHANHAGMAHIGILCLLADIAMGYATATSTEPPTPVGTVSLSLDFVSTAKVGDWLESEVEVVRVGKRMAFAHCYLCVAGKRVVRASVVLNVAGQ